MTLEELKNAVQSEGLFPIHVAANVDMEEYQEQRFIGSLDEFIRAAKALKADVVFVSNWTLEESEFTYSSETNDYVAKDSGSDEEAYEVDLRSLIPSLGKYESYIGKDCAVRLSVPMTNGGLDLFLKEPWWLEFMALRDEAIGKIEEDSEARRAKLEVEREGNMKKLIGQLRSLINDEEFIAQPTQRAMRVYALEKIPELEQLNRMTLQSEIQTLDDKLKAKGQRHRH